VSWGEVIYLRPSEIIRDRPFTDPQNNAADLGILYTMREKLQSILSQSQEPPHDTGPVKMNLREDDGSRHRLVIVDWAALRGREEVAVVGFFGQARTDVDHTPIMDLENELMDQLQTYPGLLSYYNLRLPDDRFGNLVLCAGEAVKEAWRDNPTHQRAVELSPRHYHSIRLHNGLLPGGLMSQNGLVLVRTKYYDFRAEEPWQAVREFVA
jgi:hypothetical protein